MLCQNGHSCLNASSYKLEIDEIVCGPFRSTQRYVPEMLLSLVEEWMIAQDYLTLLISLIVHSKSDRYCYQILHCNLQTVKRIKKYLKQILSNIHCTPFVDKSAYYLSIYPSF